MLKNKILVLLLSMAFLSCGKLYLAVMGVRPFKSVNKQELSYYLKKQQISDSIILEVNASKYLQLLKDKRYDTIYYKNPGWWIQNHVQPIQTMCFDNHTQSSLFAFFNCIAETKNINQFTWNKSNELETFPPKEYTSPKWIDSLFTLKDIAHTIHYFGTDSMANIDMHKQDYTVIVIYSLSVKMQANNLINETKIYLDKFIPNRYSLYFVNCDEFLLKMSTAF